MIIEFLRAWEDETWDTELVNVPDTELVKRSDAGDDDWTLQAWAREHLSGQAQYHKVVLWAVYNTQIDSDDPRLSRFTDDEADEPERFDAEKREEDARDEAYERAAAHARGNDFEETGGKNWT